MTSKIEEIWKQYEEQMLPDPTPSSYGTIITGIRNSTTIPPYTISFGPFYAGIAEIASFANAVTALGNSAINISNALNELNDFISTCPEIPGLPTLPVFDINLIIDSIDFQFDIGSATSGLCGKQIDLPTTLLGAVQNVIHSIIKGATTNIINFMDKVNMMFAVPTRMVNNLISWIDNTKTSINAPFLAERDKLMNTLKNYRREIKITNNPIYVELINTHMNKIGTLDRKIRQLVVILKKLEDAVARFLINLENCMKLGMALNRNIQNIIAAWQKDAVCVQTKFNALITAVT